METGIKYQIFYSCLFNILVKHQEGFQKCILLQDRELEIFPEFPVPSNTFINNFYPANR